MKHNGKRKLSQEGEGDDQSSLSQDTKENLTQIRFEVDGNIQNSNEKKNPLQLSFEEDFKVKKEQDNHFGENPLQLSFKEDFKVREGQDSHIGENTRKKEKKRENFVYGNYRGYYGYRIEEDGTDPRVEMLKKDWFHNKTCLDVGCNSGNLTLIIGQKFEPKEITGVDIDPKLINAAILQKRNLRRKSTKQLATPCPLSTPEENTSNASCTTSHVQASHPPSPPPPENGLTLPSTSSPSYIPISFKPLPLPVQMNSGSLPPVFPHNVYFKQEDFIAVDNVELKYDVIICFSVSKWIHLNWGDEGVKRLFHKIYNSLFVGGTFLFEPQPWKSYKKRQHVTPVV